MRAIAIVLLLLSGSQVVLAEPLDFATMRTACKQVEKAEVVDTHCREAVDQARKQFDRFKRAAAMHGLTLKNERLADEQIKESEGHKLAESNALDRFYRVLIRQYPAVWALRQKLPTKAAN